MIRAVFLSVILGCASFVFAQEENKTYAISDSCLIVRQAELYASNESGCIGTYYSVDVSCPIRNYRFTVYNRWGEELFDSNTKGEAWNAYPAPHGQYYWIVTGYMDNDRGIARKVESTGLFQVLT